MKDPIDTLNSPTIKDNTHYVFAPSRSSGKINAFCQALVDEMNKLVNKVSDLQHELNSRRLNYNHTTVKHMWDTMPTYPELFVAFNTYNGSTQRMTKPKDMEDFIKENGEYRLSDVQFDFADSSFYIEYERDDEEDEE